MIQMACVVTLPLWCWSELDPYHHSGTREFALSTITGDAAAHLNSSVSRAHPVVDRGTQTIAVAAATMIDFTEELSGAEEM